METTWQDGALVLLHVSMGVGLAACAGLRAFLPLLVAGIAARMEWVAVSDGWAWLGSWPALTIFAAAVVFELLADKIPLVDHALDGVETVVKPLAGAALMATVVADWTPMYATVIWILVGGSLAGLVHGAKAQLRLASTGLTGGLANPVLSVIEEGVALVGSLLALFIPLLVAVVALMALAGAWVVLRRWRHRQRQRHA